MVENETMKSNMKIYINAVEEFTCKIYNNPQISELIKKKLRITKQIKAIAPKDVWILFNEYIELSAEEQSIIEIQEYIYAFNEKNY